MRARLSGREGWMGGDVHEAEVGGGLGIGKEGGESSGRWFPDASHSLLN